MSSMTRRDRHPLDYNTDFLSQTWALQQSARGRDCVAQGPMARIVGGQEPLIWWRWFQHHESYGESTRRRSKYEPTL